MVRARWDEDFQKQFSKIKDSAMKEMIIKHIEKIREFPEIGKPMMHLRKGTREVYIGHYRLSYAYIKDEDMVIILDFYHKDEQ